MIFELEKLNPNNKNYQFKIIGLKLYYLIYSSTTLFIANLIYVANVLHNIHLEQNLTASCFCCWSTGLTERKLPMQYTINVQVTSKKHGNQFSNLFHLQVHQWHTVVITQVVSLNSCELYLVTCMKQLDHCKIVEENFNLTAQDILERT